MESIKSVSARLNKHGNVVGMPKGLVKTPATTAQLKKLGVVNFKVFSGWDMSSKRYPKPDLSNIIRKKDVAVVDTYLSSKAK